jgi:hypothetical protein
METGKREFIVRTFDLRNLFGIAAMGLVFVVGTSQFAAAQGRGRDDQRQEQAKKQQERKAAEQARTDQIRQTQWNTRNRQII